MHQFPFLPINACTEHLSTLWLHYFIVTGIAYIRQEYTKIIQSVYAGAAFPACISGNKEKV